MDFKRHLKLFNTKAINSTLNNILIDNNDLLGFID